MPRFLTALLALSLLCTGPLWAEEVVLGLSKDKVSITTSFDGSDILIFGAVKREKAIPEGPPIEVIVTVAGPSMPLTVRRKAKRLGIWVNTDAVEVDRAPSFYAVQTSGPLREVLKDVEDLRHKISVPRAIRSVGAPSNISDAESFTEALIRIRSRSDLYQLREDAVTVSEQTLFRTAVRLPAALTEGDYVTRIFLTRDGQVISSYDTTIDVQKVGLERWLFELSRGQPLLYGIMSIAIAIAAGWAASAVFRMFRA
ncbi:TIGR02186 family protein [uncultured Roseobacter sp.]|uniref:TIGR02186 family protein n=1 Tax=uncultured Roseobacter sp. TaxID=114847 RepID=UPI00261AFA65|nr:TIGR02186 family protein [uncultured Roseobacter sp.]